MPQASLVLLLVPALLFAACAPLPAPGNLPSQASLQALQATALVLSANLTATAQAPTLQAEKTLAARQDLQQVWTATSAAQQTLTAAAFTATALGWTPTPDYTATLSAAAAQAKATELYGQAVRVELEIERNRAMNRVWAVTPWMVLVSLLLFALAVAWRWTRVRPIQRDARGDAPLLILNGKVYDADRNPQPLADFSGKQASIPALTAPEAQAAVTARDQWIDLATRGIPGQRTLPQQAAAASSAPFPASPPPPASVRILPPEQARPLLGDVLPHIVQDAIETDLSTEG